ncbi:MAG: sigma-70 family RNA polymerase sigma factor [Phycisphaerae bacterium]|nr:sigma-70 family RNA polymerase sigma factor [Phycisphaerae bacterium]
MKSDEELVALANKGDADAFEALYYRYRDWVYRLARRFTGSGADALDVLQETFGYLLGKFPGFKLTASMTTFLYPVVKHTALATRRKSRRFASDEEALSDMPVRTVQGTSRAELAVVLGLLGDEQREVLLMRFVDDMSLKEISAALGIPLGTVKSRLHHALQKLRGDKHTRDYFLA